MVMIVDMKMLLDCLAESYACNLPNSACPRLRRLLIFVLCQLKSQAILSEDYHFLEVPSG